MKTLSIILSIVALSFTGASAQVKPEVKPPAVEKAEVKEPIVGNWRGEKAKKAGWVFHADGTAVTAFGTKGTWRRLKSETVETKYEVRWKDGVVTGVITIERNGLKMRIKESSGKTWDAERIVDPE